MYNFIRKIQKKEKKIPNNETKNKTLFYYLSFVLFFFPFFSFFCSFSFLFCLDRDFFFQKNKKRLTPPQEVRSTFNKWNRQLHFVMPKNGSVTVNQCRTEVRTYKVHILSYYSITIIVYRKNQNNKHETRHIF